MLKFKTCLLFPSVVSRSSLLPFVPVWLASASDPCPCPSCLYRPLHTSLSLYYLFFRLSLIFSAQGCRCVVSSVSALPLYVEIQDLTPFLCLCSLIDQAFGLFFPSGIYLFLSLLTVSVVSQRIAYRYQSHREVFQK
jgi:hypothetical protein